MAAERSRPRLEGFRARTDTVRIRTTLAAVVVVGVALVGGSVALVAVLRDTLTDGIRDQAELRAQELAAVLESSGVPVAPAGGDPEDQVAQILDQTGGVVASSPNVEGETPVARLRPGESAVVRVPIGKTRFVAVAVGADTAAGRFTVVVANTLEEVIESTQTVSRFLLRGIPLLLGVVGATTWLLIGRALAPVDAIRAEVEEISAAEFHRRVPDPPGQDEIARLAHTMNRMLDGLEDS